MNKNIFITGASGFLGRYLVQTILKDTNNILYLLARSQTTEENLMDEFAWADVKRIQIVRGDITLPHLGLKRDAIRRLATKINEVWHTAAVTQFDDAYKKQLEAANVHGTKRVLDLASSFNKLTNFYYMSTAYVCGTSRGSVPEGELPGNTKFNNAYEKSKYDAEGLVRKSRLPFTIIRPSILIGESHTGDARGERSRMIYGYIMAVYHSMLRLSPNEIEFWKSWEKRGESNPLDVDLRLYGSASTTKNLITIDDAVNVCMAIRHAQDKVGKTFNVVNAHCLTLGNMLESLQNLLKVKGIKFEPGLSHANIQVKKNPAEAFAYKFTKQLRPYVISSDPQWVANNVVKLGVERIQMNSELFGFLIRNYMYTHLLAH
ncbi:MAG TPA: SDR family oxidoreductase [Burkholderiales bacterium]|nr:SDR family oxidoreductase [Burkholderiales bacterium]